ncbi:unnamed protein product [Paramecium pentaurelia]|uniref:Uncharacterized protein n=1 Tax=Paramecium pentaurelia TaxID=43138 RepID=A0A8S1VLB9_9CILI|nr:unnamed protein product [Paramecium pentaurelia]
MQDFFKGHSAKSQQFYTKIIESQAQFAWEVKRKISKKCAFTLNNLTQPIRSMKCKTLKCVYEQGVIQVILQKYDQENDIFKCIQCGEEITKQDLFFDSELSKALRLNGVCYLKNMNQLSNVQKQNYMIVNKDNQQAKSTIDILDESKYPEIENSENQQLLQILALNIYKQRMETLHFLMNQQKELSLQKYAKSEFYQEKVNMEQSRK